MRRYAAVAHLVERHLAKVEVASSSLVGRSKNGRDTPLHMVAWPSGKAKVCKTFIHQFKSGRHLQNPRALHGGFLFLPARRMSLFVYVRLFLRAARFSATIEIFWPREAL